MDNSIINWSDFANFQISDSSFFVENNNLILNGKIISNIKNSNEIYKFFQTSKKFRTDVKRLEFSFYYNLDQETIKFNDMKVNNKINLDATNFFNKSFSKKKFFKNKIYFRKFINQILKVYVG